MADVPPDGGLSALVSALKEASPAAVAELEGEGGDDAGDAVVTVWGVETEGSGSDRDGGGAPAAVWAPAVDGDAPVERFTVQDGQGGRVAGPPAFPPLLPPAGRLAVAAGPHRAGAAFTLPDGGDDTNAPRSLWLTAGSLPADGLALQLHLVRGEGGEGRGKGVLAVGGEGGWACYRVAGGALTTREKNS